MPGSGRTIRIGGASGYWGESDMGLPQLLGDESLDYIVFDYLAEVTMSIMARARAKDPEAGYAKDFVDPVMAANLEEIARQGVRIISNAGGTNPLECAKALEALISKKGLNLKVAVVLGDDLIELASELRNACISDMFGGGTFPSEGKVSSINAYLGAFPIAKALSMGADIVITGRCVDSAVSLGACIHEFGWEANDLDHLACGSLAGHIIECGPQATGGNYTDWETVAENLTDIGYPIVEISGDGSFVCTKPANSGGTVSVGTVGEQMLYEIGDPQAYALPDVTCDFSEVRLEQEGRDRVHVSGAKGFGPPANYKVSATFMNGWRGGAVSFFTGRDASRKAQVFAEAAIERAKRKLRQADAPDFSETLVEIVGDDSAYGQFSKKDHSRSVAVKIAAKHDNQLAIGLLLKEIAGLALAAPPGLSGFAGARYLPSPVLRLFSFEMPKKDVQVHVVFGEATKKIPHNELAHAIEYDPIAICIPRPPAVEPGRLVPIALRRLAYARSGDKGDKANIGVMARRADFLPWIAQTLTPEEVASRFAHYLEGEVERFYLPGSNALNFVLDRVLGGGGVSSLRNDPQGKAYAQILLETPIGVPPEIAGVV